MAKTSPVHISSYIPSSEMIELDDGPPRPMRNVAYSTGNRVSPTPSYTNNFIARPTSSYKLGYTSKRQRQQKWILGLTGLLSLITFVMVLGLVLGFIRPRNLDACKCTSPKTSGGSGALKTDEHEAANAELLNDIAEMQKTLANHNEKLTAYDNHIEQINNKIDEITGNLTNVTTSSYFSEYLDQLAREIWTNTSKISENVKNNNLLFIELVNETREQISQSKQISLSKLQELDQNTQTKFTEVFLKTEDNGLKLKKFQRFQSDSERNFSVVNQDIDDITLNIAQLTNDTNDKFKKNLNTITKSTTDVTKRISDNEIQYDSKLSELSNEVWINTTELLKIVGENDYEVKKFVNETRDEITQSRDVSLLKLRELKQVVRLNISDAVKQTDDLNQQLKKLSTHTNGEIQKARTFSHDMLQRFKTNNDQNLTSLVQSVDKLFQDITQLKNDTDNKLKANFNSVNQLLDPTKFRGPRGHNGSAGQPGPKGPAGPPGPPQTIDFTNCQHGSQQSSGAKDDPMIAITFQETKTNLMLAVTCESSIPGGTILQSESKIANGLSHTCECDNHETISVAMTCTIKYLLCQR